MYVWGFALYSKFVGEGTPDLALKYTNFYAYFFPAFLHPYCP